MPIADTLVSLANKWDMEASTTDGGYTDGLRQAARDLREVLPEVREIDQWRSIAVYVTDNDVVMCYADHDCEERSDPGWLPGRRVTLGDVVDAFIQHGRDHA